MPNLIYRVVSVCGALGYGYPKESLEKACEGRIDAVISDAGSMDAGPYYLGTGTEYFERETVKTDFTHMVEAALAKQCPLILGSCGMAGGNRNLEWMLDVAKEVFTEQKVANAKVAVISGEIKNDLIIDAFRNRLLQPTGVGPSVTEEGLRESTIVGQMGIHPLITALEAGAQFILAGRSCDIALFACDMIRRGIDPGLAYHVGHVLECGALACDPGSPSDCLVAEIYDDASALFVAPNVGRRCTPYSIAAHSLYEESHPQLQFYPEGILCMEHTEFFAKGPRVAGIRNSIFARSAKPWPWSIKLEGAHLLGKRRVSLIYCDPRDVQKISADYLVYGRNGVEKTPADIPNEREVGIIIETRAQDQESAVLLASLLTHYLIHYGYSGRKATAGNIAYPLSPNLVSFKRADGSFGAVVPSGTRDPVFLKNYPMIKDNVLKLVQNEFPDALKNATYTITEADANNPAILVRTIDPDQTRCEARHKRELDELFKLITAKATSLCNLEAPDCYEWSLYHLLQDEKVIKEKLFPITFYRASGANWRAERSMMPKYSDIGVTDYAGNVNDRTLSLIAHTPPKGERLGMRPLLEMAVVIRSKDAGINRITLDIIFNSAEDYQTALRSNLFCKENVAPIIHIPTDRIVGTFFVDTCNAIKISIDRPIISASPDERDVFGAQQQAALEFLEVPIYAAPLVKASQL